MGRDSQGRFTPGSDDGAEDVYVNRIRKRIALGATATTPVFETFDTLMNARGVNQYKWVMLGGLFRPNLQAAADHVDQADAPGYIRCQVAVGEQSSILESEDSRVIMGNQADFGVNTDGVTECNWPKPLPVPPGGVPVMSAKMTIGLFANVANNDVEIYVELWYVLRSVMGSDEAFELLQASGQLTG